MSQPSTPLVPPRPADALDYRPLCALALASVAVSGVFAVTLIALAVIGLVKAAPALLAPWLLSLPAAGVLLGLLAQVRIRRAEGALAGRTLARWGLWTGLIAGLGYSAYYFPTGLALQQQADRFLVVEGEDSGFFPRLLKGDINGAFLLTRPFSRRAGMNPDDERAMAAEFDRSSGEEGGELSRFRNSDFVQRLSAAGRAGVNVQSLGTRSWGYESPRYKVVRTYRLVTEEAQMDLAVPVFAENDPGGGSRKWYVDLPAIANLPSSHLTPLGERLRSLRLGARIFLNEWSQRLAAGAKPDPAPRDETRWEEIPVLAPTMPAAKLRKLVQQEAVAVFRGTAVRSHGFRTGEQVLSAWKEVGGRLQLEMNITMPFFLDTDRLLPEYMGEGKILLGSKEPFDVRTASGSPVWEVLSFRLERVLPAPSRMGKKAGPGGR